jgi:hypothetical protein
VRVRPTANARPSPLEGEGLDGDSHADRGEYDLVRQSFLEKAGYRLLRTSNDDVLENDVEPVLWVILKAAGQTVEGMSPPSSGNSQEQAPGTVDVSQGVTE